jgi:2-iminobutanoate/2-iminopropanoate deaminase
MRRIRLTGQLAEPIGPFTDGVEAGGFLYVAGQLSLDVNGDLVGAGDVVRQTEQVLDNVGEVLRAASATFDDVVRVGVYVRNMADRPAVNTVRLRYFGDARPVATLVEVSALALPDELVEIEAVALLPRRDA